jgi:hypothetical protein
MAFSQQTYTGQGIVQPTERSRVGEFLGAGLAGLGAGIGEGIKKFQQNKEEAKELRSSLPGLAKFMPKEERDEFLEQVAVSDLSGLRGLRRRVLEFGEMQLQQERLEEARARREAVQQQAEQTRQRGNVFQALLQTQIPEQVPIDFGPQIGAAERKLQEAERAGFSPEFKFPQPEAQMPQGAERFRQEPPQEEVVPPKFLGEYPYAQELTKFVSDTQKAGARFGGLGGFGGAGFYSAPSRFKAPTQQPERPAPLLSMTPVLQGPQTEELIEQPPAAPSQPMGPEPALEISKEVKQAAKELDLLRAQAAKGGTRPETDQEMAQRRTEIIRQVMNDNPLAAETIYTTLMGKTLEPPKLDAESRKTIGFADRMNNAERELASVLEDFNPAGTFQGLAAAMPNLMKSQDRRQYEALALDWITANLRQESGAAIGKDEYENDFKKYFPQPGDSEETVKLKQSLREQAVASKVGPIQSMFPNVNIMGMAGQSSPTTSRMSFNPSTKTIQ